MIDPSAVRIVNDECLFGDKVLEWNGAKCAGHKDHPQVVQAAVRPKRYFNGPGGHAGPGSVVWIALSEVEVNRSILRPTDTPQNKLLLGDDFDRLVEGASCEQWRKAEVATSEKRGPGRPKGSKNKPKETAGA